MTKLQKVMLRKYLHLTFKNNQCENQRNIHTDQPPKTIHYIICKYDFLKEFKTYGQQPSPSFTYLFLLTLTSTHSLNVNSPTTNTCVLTMLT